MKQNAASVAAGLSVGIGLVFVTAMAAWVLAYVAASIPLLAFL